MNYKHITKYSKCFMYTFTLRLQNPHTVALNSSTNQIMATTATSTDIKPEDLQTKQEVKEDSQEQ